MLQRTAGSLCDDGLMMVPNVSASIEVVLSNVRSQHSRHRRRSGLAQAERLREGYRYSVPSGAQPPGIKVENLARVTPGCVRGADRQTDGSALNDTVAVATTSDS